LQETSQIPSLGAFKRSQSPANKILQSLPRKRFDCTTICRIKVVNGKNINYCRCSYVTSFIGLRG
jgi:hypothetical protein